MSLRRLESVFFLAILMQAHTLYVDIFREHAMSVCMGLTHCGSISRIVAKRFGGVWLFETTNWIWGLLVTVRRWFSQRELLFCIRETCGSLILKQANVSGLLVELAHTLHCSCVQCTQTNLVRDCGVYTNREPPGSGCCGDHLKCGQLSKPNGSKTGFNLNRKNLRYVMVDHLWWSTICQSTKSFESKVSILMLTAGLLVRRVLDNGTLCKQFPNFNKVPRPNLKRKLH